MVINVVESCRPKSGACISLETDIQRDLEYESLDMIMLGSELEAEFDITIQDGDFKGVRTVGDLVRCIDNIKKI